jgi:hypothetical protein
MNVYVYKVRFYSDVNGLMEDGFGVICGYSLADAMERLQKIYGEEEEIEEASLYATECTNDGYCDFEVLKTFIEKYGPKEGKSCEILQTTVF